MIDSSDMDPELARYLNRNYWQQRSEDNKSKVPTTTTPSAPIVTSDPIMSGGKVIEVKSYMTYV